MDWFSGTAASSTDSNNWSTGQGHPNNRQEPEIKTSFVNTSDSSFLDVLHSPEMSSNVLELNQTYEFASYDNHETLITYESMTSHDASPADSEYTTLDPTNNVTSQLLLAGKTRDRVVNVVQESNRVCN